ncbi:hypothetical protein Tco_0509516 [Tanacetum coccineum]
MARQCTQPKRPRNSACFKEKILLVQAQEAGQTNDLDAFDSDCDEAPCAKLVLMVNLSNYDSTIISESIQNKNVNESLTAELERYKERVGMFEEKQKVDLNDHEKYIESQMNDMILNKNAKFAAFQKEINSLKFSLSKNFKDNESLMTTIDIKEPENIVFKVGQSTQTMHMLTKPQVFYDDTHKQARGYQNPFYLKKAQRIKPTLYDGVVIPKKHDVIHVVDYEETLILVEDSRSKMLEKQNDPVSKEKKTFWLPISNPISEQLVVPPTPVKIEVPSELPKCSIDKKCFKIQKKELLLENDKLLELIISQDLVHTVVNSLEVIDECKSIRKSYSQLQAKESSISKLRAHIATLKGKNVSDNNEPVKNASMIALGMFRLQLEPLSHRLKNNREAHEDYLKKTKEHIDTLRGIVERSRKQNSNAYLDYACKFTIRIQELLVNVSETCPSSQLKRKKLVVVTPMNKTRKFMSWEPKESSSTTQKQAALPSQQTTNKPLLSSTRVITSTSASGSQP